MVNTFLNKERSYTFLKSFVKKHKTKLKAEEVFEAYINKAIDEFQGNFKFCGNCFINIFNILKDECNVLKRSIEMSKDHRASGYLVLGNRSMKTKDSKTICKLSDPSKIMNFCLIFFGIFWVFG